MCRGPSGSNLRNVSQSFKALSQITDSLISVFPTYNLWQFPAREIVFEPGGLQEKRAEF